MGIVVPGLNEGAWCMSIGGVKRITGTVAHTSVQAVGGMSAMGMSRMSYTYTAATTTPTKKAP